MAEELIDSIQDQINGQQLSLSKEINALSRILKKCLVGISDRCGSDFHVAIEFLKMWVVFEDVGL